MMYSILTLNLVREKNVLEVFAVLEIEPDKMGISVIYGACKLEE